MSARNLSVAVCTAALILGGCAQDGHRPAQGVAGARKTNPSYGAPMRVAGEQVCQAETEKLPRCPL